MTKPKPTTLAPPEHLEAVGRVLFLSVVEHTADDGAVVDLSPVELAVLVMAAETADTIEALSGELAETTWLSAGSAGQVTVHPLVAEIRQQRVVLNGLLSKLRFPESEAERDVGQRARKAAGARWK